MRLVYCLFLCFCCQFLFAQKPPGVGGTPDTLKQVSPSDSLSTPDASKKKGLFGFKKRKKNKGALKELFNFKKNYPNPRKAIVLSAILPGTGQIYNKKYWKLPIVYGGLGAMGYLIYFNTDQQRRFNKALELRLDDDEFPLDEFIQVNGNGTPVGEILDEASIRSWRAKHQKNKELSYIGLVFTYILTGVDAYVDAHLINFNVSDDLSLQVKPEMQVLPNLDTSVGIGLGLRFRDKKVTELPIDIYSAR